MSSFGIHEAMKFNFQYQPVALVYGYKKSSWLNGSHVIMPIFTFYIWNEKSSFGAFNPLACMSHYSGFAIIICKRSRGS